MTDLSLKQKIMWRVRAIYFLRSLVRPIFLKFYTFVILGLIFGNFVSIAQVVNNMPAGLLSQNAGYFFWSAYLQTEFLVQVGSVASVLLFGLILRDLGQFFGKTAFLSKIYFR